MAWLISLVQPAARVWCMSLNGAKIVIRKPKAEEADTATAQ
jgi:hypothetical protein